MKRKGSFIIVTAVLVVILITLLAGRGWIASYTYRKTGENLASKLDLELETKYGKELEYTLDKFWQCYDQRICNRNDMTDVMYRMRELNSKSQITDMEVFEFIGFVSGLYSDRIEKHHMEKYQELEKPGG